MLKKISLLAAGVAFAVMMVVNFQYTQGNKMNFNLNLEALASEQAGCEDKVTRNGPIITVTVCNRYTSFWDSIAGTDCGSSSDSSCTFTNT